MVVSGDGDDVWSRESSMPGIFGCPWAEWNVAASDTTLERLRLCQCVVREEKVFLFLLWRSILRVPIVYDCLGSCAIGCEIVHSVVVAVVGRYSNISKVSYDRDRDNW